MAACRAEADPLDLGEDGTAEGGLEVRRIAAGLRCRWGTTITIQPGWAAAAWPIPVMISRLKWKSPENARAMITGRMSRFRSSLPHPADRSWSAGMVG